MAVVSTFIYLATIDEAFKRAIHTAVAILTALMAITKATRYIDVGNIVLVQVSNLLKLLFRSDLIQFCRSSNVALVIGIGTLGLLIGWVIEYSTTHRSFSFPTGFCLNMLVRWVFFLNLSFLKLCISSA